MMEGLQAGRMVIVLMTGCQVPRSQCGRGYRGIRVGEASNPGPRCSFRRKALRCAPSECMGCQRRCARGMLAHVCQACGLVRCLPCGPVSVAACIAGGGRPCVPADVPASTAPHDFLRQGRAEATAEVAPTALDLASQEREARAEVADRGPHGEGDARDPDCAPTHFDDTDSEACYPTRQDVVAPWNAAALRQVAPPPVAPPAGCPPPEAAQLGNAERATPTPPAPGAPEAWSIPHDGRPIAPGQHSGPEPIENMGPIPRRAWGQLLELDLTAELQRPVRTVREPPRWFRGQLRRAYGFALREWHATKSAAPWKLFILTPRMLLAPAEETR